MDSDQQQPAQSSKQIVRRYFPDIVIDSPQFFRMKVPILRPNPDWEEDLERSTIIDDKMRERIKTYSQLPKKKVKPPCTCHPDPWPKTGVAPWLKLNDGKFMPAFGVGTWPGFNESEWRDGKQLIGEEVMQAVENAIDVGYRHIDSAHVYKTEIQVGMAINNKIAEGVVKREELYISTKVWNDKHRKMDVLASLRETLLNMNLTYVDLYLMHWPIAFDVEGNLEDIDYLETWEGMIEAQVLTLTRSIGVCNFNETQLYRMMTGSHVKPAVLQIEINLNLQQPSLLSFCRKHDIVVVGYAPFGSVFDSNHCYPAPTLNNPYLNKLAFNYKKTVAQIILRYIVELGVAPLPKWVTKEYMEENLNVFDFQLTKKERDKLNIFDKNIRTIKMEEWTEAPDYPF